MMDGRARERAGRAILDSLIVLSVAATLVEEAAIVTGAVWRVRSLASTACLALDVFFLLEFALRFGKAFFDHRLASYMKAEGGWMDCLAALVPLVFTSGPFLFDATLGLGSTTTIAALGDFRLLRGLGLLRSLRLLRLMGPTPEGRVDTARPTIRTATFALCASLLVLVGAEAASLLGFWPDAHEALSRKRLDTLSALRAHPDPDSIEATAAVDSDLLLVRSNGTVVFTRYSAEEYRRRFGPDEIGYLGGKPGIEAFFSLSGELQAQAAATLAAGICALAVLAALSLACSYRSRREDESEDDGGAANAPASSALRAQGQWNHQGDEPAGMDELAGLLGEDQDDRTR
jgi:hypothetical protein